MKQSSGSRGEGRGLSGVVAGVSQWSWQEREAGGLRLGTCPRTNRWTRTDERYAWRSRGAMRLDRNTVPRFGLRGVSSTADGPYQILKLAGVSLLENNSS